MNFSEEKLKEILLKENYVDTEKIKIAEAEAKAQHLSIIDYLLGKNIITNNLLGQAIAEAYGLAYIDLENNPPEKNNVLRLSEDFSKAEHVIFYNDTGKIIGFASDNPTQELVEKLKQKFPDKDIRIAYALPEQINQIYTYYQKSLATRFNNIISQKERVAPEIIDEIILDALTLRASDIHFEPQVSEIIVRFRVDGVLQEAGRISKALYENILNRIKVLAHLRIDEHFSAQDGALRYETNNRVIDMRVSVAPVLDGEKIVIRILAQYISSYSLKDLGLSENDQKILTASSKKPFGMIIVSGPTGSGKTTTLYALLKNINRPDINIMTIEDPIEYRIIGANQIQVNQQTNLTFAKGLRSIVRQDPDVILVGEIRDTETAEISVNAALTGHLLFSTFHANDAATVIPRMLDMKIEPFLLSSTLETIIAQRLVRKICEKCRYSLTITQGQINKYWPKASQFFPKNEKLNLYAGKGCQTCNGTGFKGRSAIFEIINVNHEMKELILKNATSGQIWQLANKNGSTSMFDDGINKVKNGITTLEELMRVATPPED